MALKTKLKLGLISALFAGSVFSVSAQTLRVGMETTFAPFEFYNANNELVGFDVDLAKRICELLKDDCDFQNLPFDGLIGALKMRKIDFAISGIDLTPARQKQVDFSDVYYENAAQAFVVNKGSADLTFDQLKAKKIGVQNGTTQQRYLNTEFPSIDVMNYAQFTIALMDLKNHRIDALFVDNSVATEMVKENPDYKMLTEKVTDPTYFGQGLGIAVRQGNKVLLDKINGALNTMKEDGSYQAIYKKWFD